MEVKIHVMTVAASADFPLTDRIMFEVRVASAIGLVPEGYFKWIDFVIFITCFVIDLIGESDNLHCLIILWKQ